MKSSLPNFPRSANAFSDEEKAHVLGLVMALDRARAAWFEKASRVLARHGLTLAEFDVLSSLERASPKGYTRTPKELQASLLITSGGLTKVLRQMEARGLILRSQEVADRRIKPVTLAPQAVTLTRMARDELFLVIGGWFSGALSFDEMNQASALLNRLGGFEPVPDYPDGI